MSDKLLQVENLKTYLPLEEGLLKAVDGISFAIGRGETMAWSVNQVAARAWR